MGFFEKIAKVFNSQKENNDNDNDNNNNTNNDNSNSETKIQKDTFEQEDILKRVPFHGRTPMAPDFVPLNPAEARMLAEQQIKIIHDCEHLVSETTNPDVFIKRYLLLLDSLEWLSELEKVIEFKRPPHIYFKKVENIFQQQIQLFINRCFEKYKNQIAELKQSNAKMSRVGSFYTDISEIQEYFDENNQKYFELKDKELFDIATSETKQQNSEKSKVQKTKLNRNPELKWFFDEIDDIKYSIPNPIEKFSVKEWDKLFSLEVFLRNSNVPNDIVNDIKNANNCYEECMNYFEKKYIQETETSSYYSTIWNVKNKLTNEICVMTIFEKNPKEIIEKYFLLLLYRISDSLYSYLIPNGLIDNNNDYMLKMYLESFKRNDTKNFKLDNEGSSFILACQNSSMNINNIFNLGFSYIESKKDSLYIDQIINILKFDSIKNIIGKEIEHQFKFGKVYLKKLLLSQKTKKEVNSDIVFRYDIPNMKNEDGYYVLTEDGKKVAEQDILLSLNSIFKNGYCRTLKVEFQSNQIHFEPAENEDISYVCRVIYNPYTKTGKEAKYPYYLRFVIKDVINNKGQNGTLSGEIHYLRNGEIGKVDVTFYNGSVTIKINKNNKGEILYKEN